MKTAGGHPFTPAIVHLSGEGVNFTANKLGQFDQEFPRHRKADQLRVHSFTRSDSNNRCHAGLLGVTVFPCTPYAYTLGRFPSPVKTSCSTTGPLCGCR